MNSIQKASYISTMPYEMFTELLSDRKAALKSFKRASKLMVSANNQRPYDKRTGVKKLVDNSFLVSCVQNNESVLTTKMVSLSIIFDNELNPGYFDEICQIFTKNDYENGAETLDYSKIASIYNTSTDNVKSYILYNDYRNNILEASKQQIKK